MDLVQFNHDMSSHPHAPCIHEDFLSRVRNGINGTPTFYMNGIRIRNNGSWDLRTLQKTLRSKFTKDNLGSHLLVLVIELLLKKLVSSFTT